MPKLHYISFARFPTEKAHGLQIAQNCEAFADIGYDVVLWVSNRNNTPEMSKIDDVHGHYGVTPNFDIRRIPSVDLYWLANSNPRLEYIAFFVHIITYCLMMLLIMLRNRADIYYSRDEYALLALSLIVPKAKLAYEAHQFALSDRRKWIQNKTVQRAEHIITITSKFREDCIQAYNIAPERILVAHDGIRAERFTDLPDKQSARAEIGWSQDAFIVGFIGRLKMLSNLDKGVGTLIDALAPLETVSIALVGGPDEVVEELRKKWRKHGLSKEQFLYAGTVKPDAVPTYLRAFDVCAMPHPFHPQFAYYTSPLKLFEYMASERAIVASDLPSWADVITHEETALLVPAGDVDALSQAIQRLQSNDELREQLGKNAHEHVFAQYTWQARAEMIRQHIEREQ